MTPANLSTVQALAATCLAANATLTGLPTFLELDETATPAELAAVVKNFEHALLTRGVALLILSPELVTLDKADYSAVSTALALTVCIVENPEVNRGADDATTVPARTPARKSCRLLLEAIVTALLPEFLFPPQAAGKVEWADGYWGQYLVAHKRHVIRAASAT